MENIHPNLKKEAILVRFGLPLFLAFTVLPLVIVFVVLQITLEFNFTRTIILFFSILLSVVVTTFIYVKFFGKYKQTVQRASSLLYSNKPETGIISPEVLMSVWGPIFRIKSDHSNNSDLVTFKIDKRRVKKFHSKSVELYKDTKGIHDTVVIKVMGSYIIGKLQNRKKAEDVIHEFKKFKRGMLMFAAASIIVLVIVQFFHMKSINKNADFAVNTTSWPITSGRITFSSVNEVRIKEGKTSVKGYSASIRYVYNLNGKEYEGSNIHLAYEPTKNLEEARYYISKYPLGATAAVHYNPKDYSFSLLEAGHQEDILKEVSEVYIVTGAVSGILIITIIILMFVFREQEKKTGRFFQSQKR